MKAMFQLPEVDDLLTHEEVVAITGCGQKKGQIAWLEKHEWPHVVYADGWPRVHRWCRLAKMMGADPETFIVTEKKWDLDVSTVS